MSELTHAIRRIANPERRAGALPGFMARTFSTAAVTGLTALLLVPAPGHALSLGEITVRSALGQPLKATVPVRTAPGELLKGDCIQVGPVSAGSGLAPLSQARVLVTGEGRSTSVRELVITTPRPLYEPLYELALQVNCPGAPGVVRQYVLMLDLPAVLESAAPVAPPAVAPMARPAPARATTQSRPAVTSGTPGPATAPIAGGIRYRVQPGDTLSSIAARVQGRTVGIWAMVEQIHAANPGVFPNGDLNRLPAGVELLIPGTGIAPAATTAGIRTPADPARAPALMPAPLTAPMAAAVPEAPVAASPAAPAETLLPGTPPEAVVPEAVVAETMVDEEAEVALDEAPPPAPATTSRSRTTNKAAAEPGSSATTDTDASGTSPLAALAAGAGFGILISLLLWSRRLRDRLRPAAAGAPTRTGAARTATAAAATTAAAAAAPVVARVGPRPEPAISVSYEDLDEPLARSFGQAARNTTPAPAPAPAPMDDITADLEQLFLDEDDPGAHSARMPALETDGSDTREQFVTGGFEPPEPDEFSTAALEDPTRLTSGDLDPRTLGVDLDDELTRLGDAAPIDVGFADASDLELDHPTVQQAMQDLEQTRVSGTGNQASSTGTGTRTPSLLEAMDLLERDYEEELTASQLLDPELVQAALEGGPDTDQTGIRRRR